LPLYNAVLEAIGPELDTVLSTSYYGANKKLIKVQLSLIITAYEAFSDEMFVLLILKKMEKL